MKIQSYLYLGSIIIFLTTLPCQSMQPQFIHQQEQSPLCKIITQELGIFAIILTYCDDIDASSFDYQKSIKKSCHFLLAFLQEAGNVNKILHSITIKAALFDAIGCLYKELATHHNPAEQEFRENLATTYFNTIMTPTITRLIVFKGCHNQIAIEYNYHELAHKYLNEAYPHILDVLAFARFCENIIHTIVQTLEPTSLLINGLLQDYRSINVVFQIHESIATEALANNKPYHNLQEVVLSCHLNPSKVSINPRVTTLRCDYNLWHNGLSITTAFPSLKNLYIRSIDANSRENEPLFSADSTLWLATITHLGVKKLPKKHAHCVALFRLLPDTLKRFSAPWDWQTFTAALEASITNPHLLTLIPQGKHTLSPSSQQRDLAHTVYPPCMAWITDTSIEYDFNYYRSNNHERIVITNDNRLTSLYGFIPYTALAYFDLSCLRELFICSFDKYPHPEHSCVSADDMAELQRLLLQANNLEILYFTSTELDKGDVSEYVEALLIALAHHTPPSLRALIMNWHDTLITKVRTIVSNAHNQSALLRFIPDLPDFTSLSLQN